MSKSGGSAERDFGDWVTPHLRALRAVAAREVGPDEAADLVQLVLLRAWRRWDTFDGERGSPRSWLMAILLDQSRRHRVRARPLPDEDPQQRQPRPGDGTVDTRIDLDRTISTLPKRQRQVVVLFYLADLSVREVGAVLAISEGSVKGYLAGARAALRSALEDA